MSHTTVIDKELDDEGVKIIDNLFNEEILKKDDENHKPKDVPAYHIDEENYSNEILNPKIQKQKVKKKLLTLSKNHHLTSLFIHFQKA